MASLTPAAYVAAQLRAAAPDADWNAQGENRALELGAMFAQAGIINLESLSVEAVDIWECFRLVGFSLDPRSQADYDLLRARRVTDEGPRALVARSTGANAWFAWNGNMPGIKNDPAEMLMGRGFWPYRFRDGRSGRVVGYLGDTNNDATITNEKPLFKFLDGEMLVAWSARGSGHVKYMIRPAPSGFIVVPVWGSSSAGDKAFALQNIRSAVVIGSIGFGFAGLGSLGSNLGAQIVSPAFAAANPTITAAIGNTAIGTAMNGGDVESAVKNSLITAGADVVGVAAGTQATRLVGVDAAGRVASAATSAYIRGGDVEKAVGMALLRSVPDAFPSTTTEIPKMNWLSSIESGNIGETDYFGTQAFPGVMPTSGGAFSAPSVVDSFDFDVPTVAAGERSFWDSTKSWAGSTFTRDNLRTVQDVTKGVADVIKTVRSLDQPGAPVQPQRFSSTVQTIRNPNGSVTQVDNAGNVRVLTPEQAALLPGMGSGFNVSPQMLAIGGAALLGVVLLMRKR